MPRNERVLVVFVASPSDLEAERARLEEVVRELNTTWSRTLGLRLELVRWETHGFPGVGEDPQDVINHELTDEPDIFIGMMWGCYGTPTGRAGSGTEEEFTRALARHEADPTEVKIMFYFKDAPISPSAIDPDQIGRVQKFQASLGSEGALYWKFATVDEFERLLRLHLARQIQQLAGSVDVRDVHGSQRIPSEQAVTQTDDELGLLDFLDQVDEYFSSLNQITERISTETSALGKRMEERTLEMNSAKADSGGQVERREARALIEKAADDMGQFVARMSAEIPLFRETLRKGTASAANAALMGAAMASEDKEEVRPAREGLATFRDGLVSALQSTESFKASVQRIPRMTAALNKAKREVATTLQQIIDSLEKGGRAVSETIKALDVLLGEDGSSLGMIQTASIP